MKMKLIVLGLILAVTATPSHAFLFFGKKWEKVGAFTATGKPKIVELHREVKMIQLRFTGNKKDRVLIQFINVKQDAQNIRIVIGEEFKRGDKHTEKIPDGKQYMNAIHIVDGGVGGYEVWIK